MLKGRKRVRLVVQSLISHEETQFREGASERSWCISEVHRSGRLGIRIMRATHHMGFLLLLVSCAPCFCQTNSTPINPDATQVISALNPQYENLRSKLVSPGKGWVALGKRLFWTENNGQSWRDISPPDGPMDYIFPVFFLDRSHGWVVTAEETDDYKDDGVHLLSTRDGGKTWQTMVLRRSAYKLMSDFSPSAVFFSDPKHGWMIWHLAVMHSYADALLATMDGGRTWKRLPEPPGGGPMQFISPLDGWMIGEQDVKGFGMSVPMNDTLWATNDGGVHWRVVPVTILTDSQYQDSNFLKVKFKNQRDGMLAAREFDVSGDSKGRFVNLSTQDGGKTWRHSQFEALNADPSFGNTQFFWSVFGHDAEKTSIREGDQVISYTLPEGLSLDGSLGDVDFIDDSNAWANFTNKNVPLVSLPGRGFAPQELLSTSDGGKTFQIISPPAAALFPFPQPELRAVNHVVVWIPPDPYRARKPWLARLPIPPKTPPRAQAGGPIELGGRGFLSENTVWFDTRAMQVASKDGDTLLFLVPSDLNPGIYSVHIENAHGKTEPANVQIYPQRVLHISDAGSETAPFSAKHIHPGGLTWLVGSGFLLENTVSLCNQFIAAQSTDGISIHLIVPSSTVPGPCEIYVSNVSGKSNILTVIVE
jgi:photosystem II stability/assembly factor-like uncharacterized protein